MVVKAIEEKWDFSKPYDGATPTTYNKPNRKIMAYIVIPTNQQMTARRPDLIIRNKKVERIWTLDVVCAWESLVEECEKEKLDKYRMLAANMGRRERSVLVQ